MVYLNCLTFIKPNHVLIKHVLYALKAYSQQQDEEEERAERTILKLRAEFNALDIEQCGYLKFGRLPLKDKSKEREIFDEIDTNKDGKISFDGKFYFERMQYSTKSNSYFFNNLNK